jgi:hypothetical protein
MPTANNTSALLKNSLRKSLYHAALSLSLAACLWPAAANAQSWNPTLSDAHFNTAAGSSALTSHTSGGGSYNTGLGYATLGSSTGSANTAVGAAALFYNSTGGSNTASGFDALTANKTGSYNTASGANALQSITDSSNNVAIGAKALIALDNGGSNIALGASAGKNLTGGNRNIYIGHNGAASESNVTRIGQLQTKTFIAGIAGVAASGATVVVRPSGQLGVVASSARYKTDIRDLSDASDKLSQLRPVSYSYKTEPGVTHFGLIAEEVDKVMPELVVRDAQNRPETVQYHELIPLLLQQRNEQQARLDRQDEVIARLTAEVAELRRAAGLSSRQARR